MTAPNCYTCQHRRSCPGDTHSRCAHPDVGDDMFSALMQTIVPTKSGLVVKGNPHGIRMGWFMHPVNFDPAWLEECNGYLEKKNE